MARSQPIHASRAVPKRDDLPEVAGWRDPHDRFICRQPIFDRRIEVVGYELIVGGCDEQDVGLTPAATTAKTIVAAFTEIGIESIVGRRPAYVEATREFLVDEQAHALPPSCVALEVRPEVALDPEVAPPLASLARGGYRIVLDDFAWSDELTAMLGFAQAVKIVVGAHDDAELGDLVERLAPYGVDLIADGVDTPDEIERCRRLGFTHFQGDFLSRPSVVIGRGVPADRVNKMQLIALLQDESGDPDELDRLICRDVGLSFRLLRYLNSAYFFLPHHVASVRDAIVMLGPRAIRRWATLIVVADIDDRPSELVVTAMVRAKMCELLATASRESGDPDSAFTVGLFSVVDVLLGVSMRTLVEALPLSEPVREALVERTGSLGQVLDCVLAYEFGDFDGVLRWSADTGLVFGAYLEAIGWADRSRTQLVA